MNKENNFLFKNHMNKKIKNRVLIFFSDKHCKGGDSGFCNTWDKILGIV